VDAVAAANGDAVLVGEGLGFQGGKDGVHVRDQQVRGLCELDGEAGVEHVAAGHAEMDEAALRADFFGEPGEESDDVVPGLLLYGVYARQIDGTDVRQRFVAAGAYDGRGLAGDLAERGHGFGRQNLDLEPDAEPVLRGPDRHHPRSAVARHHGDPPRQKVRLCHQRAAFGSHG
jgi:hypothetical protein